MFCRQCGKDIGKTKTNYCKFCGESMGAVAKHKSNSSIQTKKPMLNKWWPDMSIEKNQIKSARLASVIAVIIAIITAIVVIIGGLDQAALIDAVLFAIIAFFLWRMSRVAAVAGLGLYLLEIVYSINNNPERGLIGWLLSAFFILIFANGVRATFAHKQKISE